MLNIMRKVTFVESEENKIQVGDQISIPLEGFGTFKATAQKVDNNSVLFIFDDVIARQPMNKTNTNVGGFENSQLHKWLQGKLLPSFPEELRSRITELTLPTVGQIVGWNDEWDRANLEPDNDEQLPLMKERKNRVVSFEGDFVCYWLRNSTKKDCSAAYFASVTNDGYADCHDASYSDGVRPVFRLIKEKSGGRVPQGKHVDVASMYPYSAIAEMLFGAKKINPYNEMARETKALMDAYVNAGFTEKQAFHMVVSLSTAVIGGMV